MKHSKSRNPAVTHYTRRSSKSPSSKATTVTGEFAQAAQRGSTGSFVSRFDKLRQFPVFPQADEVDAATTALLFVPLNVTRASALDLAFMQELKDATDPTVILTTDSSKVYHPHMTVVHGYKVDDVGKYVVPSITLSSRQEVAARAALRRLPELMRALDQERIDDILKASIAAAIPLQRGARGQAELLAKRISEVLASVPMLTAAEVGRNAGTTSDKPEALAAQWSNRKQVFTVELAGHGIRFPSFQFQPDSGKPWPALAKVLPTLLTAFAPIDLLIWFVSPHPALDQLTPDSILHDAERLQSAADATLKPVDFW